ncbi:trans-sialidase, putative, partial [Trypanosoma cruzi marinkellei]
MLVGNYSSENVTTDEDTELQTSQWGLLLVKGNVSEESGGDRNKRVFWEGTYGLPCTSVGDHHDSLTGIIGSGGSGVKTKDGTLVFPVEGTKKKTTEGTEEAGKTVSLILYSSDAVSWTLSNRTAADGCSDPSILEWKDNQLMMMTACDDGRRRVYESGDKGELWTEALGTLSRVWGNNDKRHERGVGSGFTTATIGDREVMLVTLPVYAKDGDKKKRNEKGELHLWLTDNTHIVDIGPVSRNDDVSASSLLYKSGTNNDKKLIALYEKKGSEEAQSPGMVSVLLTDELQRVKD